MEIYLPVAQLAVNSFVLLGIGLAVGFLSGMLGVSGGFITTPLLIFYGIPSGIAVASQASPIAASALVGAIRQGGKKSVDYKMGLWLLLGGLAGSSIGVAIFRLLQQAGQIDFTIRVSYLVLLGSIGTLMLVESVRAIRAARKGVRIERRPGQHTWIHRLPFKMRFYRSALYISVIPVVVLGLMVGVMTAILGTGGAFILIPAKVYLLRMRTTSRDRHLAIPDVHRGLHGDGHAQRGRPHRRHRARLDPGDRRRRGRAIRRARRRAAARGGAAHRARAADHCDRDPAAVRADADAVRLLLGHPALG